MTANSDLVLKDAPRPEISSALAPMGVKDLLNQLTLIQQVMKNVMQDGQHYGKVPGCGDKPALFKPGAEKLCFVFRLAPSFDTIERELPNGHREYRVKCRLETIGGRVFVGEGEGICSTMEGKYRFRTGPKKLTGRPVPKEYWDVRESNPAKAQQLLGGPGFGTGKNGITQQWEIVEVGERAEHDNPADYFNTVVKMAQKRAFVAVTLTATAASDCFTQDLDELDALNGLFESETSEVRTGNGAGAGAAPTTVAGSSAPAGGGEPKKVQSAPPTTSSAAWRSFPIPSFIKKHAGKKLGELAENDLVWWAKNYVPKPFGNRGINPNDLAFRKALDEALAEMGQNAGEAAEKITKNLDQSAPNGGGDTDGPPLADVPY